MSKVSYGYDAPDIMRNFLLFGSTAIAAGILLIGFSLQSILIFIGYALLSIGIVLLFLGISMVAYGLIGKYRIRDLMLSRVNWAGNEQVLDIGTGQGLLMIGAAKFLTTGMSTGIDIWSEKDLSNNSIKKTLDNAKKEGVSGRVEVRSEDARELNFKENYFDVVLSQFCLHNIESKQDQEKACFEIARVLKPGGKALIGDYIPTTDYAKIFKKAGLQIKGSRAYFATALGPTWIVEAVKPKQN